jgi:ribosomal protein S18 acetylase RimI-like enzyme
MRLVPMAEEEYEAWQQQEIRDYAADKVKAGTWRPDDAIERSRDAFLTLLPDGVRSEGQYLYTLEDEAAGRKVGVIWFAVRAGEGKPSAFIYDIVVDEAERGRGYGRQAMLALEDKVRALGLDTIGLHVFGHSTIARDLYLKVGYEITDYVMVKKLGET